MSVHCVALRTGVASRPNNAGPACAQHVHPSLRQTPCVAMLKGLLFKFDTPYVLANVCEAVPETMSLPSKSVLPNPKKSGKSKFKSIKLNAQYGNQRTVPPQCTAPAVPCDICTHWVGGNSSSQHAPQPHAPSKPQSGRPRPRAHQIARRAYRRVRRS
jgi:hypothetical protein